MKSLRILPSDQSLGYYQTSLRDESEMPMAIGLDAVRPDLD
jgi:hypothetical protein